MEKFRIAMGFPMLATVVWLGNLIPLHYGRKAWWFGIFIVILALAAWIYGEFVQRSNKRKGIVKLCVIALLAGGYFYIMEMQLNWRFPPAQVENTSLLQETPDGIAWKKWSSAAVNEARAQGRVVFVDFTADWCLTCQANKKTSIEIPSVRQKLKELNAVALLGDYTRVPSEITAELKAYGRAGVPLVLVYPRNQELAPKVLPELLTPGIVLQALEEAAR
jgi:thiol:disulfide interchange protein DsbD